MKTYRLFSIVCYDNSEDLDFSSILTLCQQKNLTYFYIKHFSEKSNSKDHYHFAIYFEKPTTIKQLAQQLQINENKISIQDDFGNRYTLKKTIGYFLHYNNKDKINYDISEIISNNNDLVHKYYNILTGGKNEKNELLEIIAFIEENHCSTKDLLKFCIENDYLKTFKKYSYVLHNTCMYER